MKKYKVQIYKLLKIFTEFIHNTYVCQFIKYEPLFSQLKNLSQSKVNRM